MLRIDDSDATRSRDVYLEDIFQTLDWLGLDYDFGASGVADFKKNYSQQHKTEQYLDWLKKLRPWLYTCQCSRKQIAQVSTSHLYPQTCRRHGLPLSQVNTAWRIKSQPEPIRFQEFLQGSSDWNVAEQMGDFVVRRKDGLPAYQVVSLAEDLENNVNFLVRGTDLIGSTVAQVYLAQLLGQESFMQATFLHHPLILESPNRKLSKSAGSIAIKSMRETGMKPEQVYQMLAKWLQIPAKEVASLQDLLNIFEPEKHLPQQDLYWEGLLEIE